MCLCTVMCRFVGRFQFFILLYDSDVLWLQCLWLAYRHIVHYMPICIIHYNMVGYGSIWLKEWNGRRLCGENSIVTMINVMDSMSTFTDTHLHVYFTIIANVQNTRLTNRISHQYSFFSLLFFHPQLSVWLFFWIHFLSLSQNSAVYW